MRIGSVAAGQIVCAVFHEDGGFYRARIVRNLGKGVVRLFFVDYGNSADVNWQDIYKLADQFVSQPAKVNYD